MQIKIISFIFLLLLSSCSLNELKSTPGETNIFNIKDTPAYIVMNDEINMDVLLSDISRCKEKFDVNTTAISRVIKTFGGYTGLVGAFAVIDILTTGGALFQILVLPTSLIAIAGWSLYSSADALSALGQYKNLETCLENNGYDVVFYVESK